MLGGVVPTFNFNPFLVILSRSCWLRNLLTGAGTPGMGAVAVVAAVSAGGCLFLDFANARVETPKNKPTNNKPYFILPPLLNSCEKVVGGKGPTTFSSPPHVSVIRI